MCQTKNAGITQSVFFFEEMKATHICVKKYVFVKRCFSCCAWVPLNDSFPQSNVAHISFFRKNHIKMHPLCKEKIVHAFMYQRFVSHLLRMFSSFFQPFGVNPSTTKRCKNQLFPSYLNETPQRILHKSLWSFSLVFESIGSLSSLSFFSLFLHWLLLFSFFALAIVACVFSWTFFRLTHALCLQGKHSTACLKMFFAAKSLSL